MVRVEMPSIKRVFVSVLIGVFAIFALEISFGAVSYFDNWIKMLQLHTELAKSKDVWDSQNIADYSFEVSYLAAPGPFCYARITVKQNEVVEVSERQGLNENSPFKVPGKDEWDKGFCKYSSFTIAMVFDTLMNSTSPFVKEDIEFDPEYGFVTAYSGNSNVVRCLFCVISSETGLRTSFYNFRRLDTGVP